MAHERMFPLLPCRDLDESILFYRALGFTQTYRQLRPNPYAVVAREDIQIHLFGMEGFHPEDSYGSVLIGVPDPDHLYEAFAVGLRTAFGKLPVTGIPRILRPRKKYGVVHGFSVVDPGGNWLRIYRLNDAEPEEAAHLNAAHANAAQLDAEPKAEGLAQILLVAARLGDSRGDEQAALKTLENGLARYPNAAALDLARAYLYRAELAVRLHDSARALASLAAFKALDLNAAERAALEEERTAVEEIIQEMD